MVKNQNHMLLETLNLDRDDLPLLTQALTHSSYINRQAVASNERLEFLGDAVLELVVSDHLYRTYPHVPEGQLTKMRAAVVCEASLALVAENLKLGEHLRLGKGTFIIPSILADAVEALLGAVYLSKGFAAAQKTILTLFQGIFADMKGGMLRLDYKTLLQEYAQENYATTPSYKIVAEEGPPHAKVFTAQLRLNQQVMGQGCGKTKKEAEQQAAQEAYKKIKDKRMPSACKE